MGCRKDTYANYTISFVQLQQYKASGQGSKTLEDRPKENGQADDNQQQQLQQSQQQQGKVREPKAERTDAYTIPIH